MGDFPTSVNTHTGGNYTNTQLRDGRPATRSAMVDVAFIRSFPAILMIVEVVLGLIHWALIVAVPVQLIVSPYGWVLFVAITTWLLTLALFFVILFGVHQRITIIPWTLAVMVYNVVVAILYLIAFAVNAAYVDVYFFFTYYRNMAAAAFFGSVVWVAYTASAVFSFLDWKSGTGRSDTPGTVPT